MTIKGLNKYVTESRSDEYMYSGINRARSSKPPTSWDDKPVSARREVYNKRQIRRKPYA